QGMAQKVNVARALLHRPDLLILDEPVANLDPHGIKQVRDLVAEENRRGATARVSSHPLSAVERTCRPRRLMPAGRPAREGARGQLRAQLAGTTRLRVEVDRPHSLVHRLHALPYVREVALEDTTLVLAVDGDEDYRGHLSREIVGAGATILSMEVREASLE